MGLEIKTQPCEHMRDLYNALEYIKVRMADPYSEVYLECKECGSKADLVEDKEE